MSMSLLQCFCGRVEEFLSRHGVTATRFGREAANDPNFVFDLRNGRKPNPDLIESVDGWMVEFDARKQEKGDDPAKPAASRVAA